MDSLPEGFIFNSSFGKRNEHFETLVDKYITHVDRFIVISPEYNGSFPGVFKAFLDALDPKLFNGSKVGLVGVSTGRAGNLRGMDHLSDIFNHLNSTVMPFKLPISRLNEFLIQGELAESEKNRLIEHIERFQSF
jgi:NAD(P)H-dependent FMN reductase